ncbi:MAG TPA: hypothetical protein EYQ84_05540 [Nitrospinaceae bacterium]|nr:hypothetical protein [Nitrospinaceae bacterium]
MKSAVLCTLVGTLLIAGCASNPATIRATYVSPLEYSNLDCDQLRLEMIRVSRRVATASGQQQEERDDDKAALAVGIILFWPALFFMGGDDMKQEIALLKGQYEALETVAIQKKCNWMLEVQDQRIDQTTQEQP